MAGSQGVHGMRFVTGVTDAITNAPVVEAALSQRKGPYPKYEIPATESSGSRYFEKVIVRQ